MPTLASAQTVTFGVQGDQTITLNTSPGTEGTLSWNAPNGVQVQTIGPMPLVNQVIRMNGVSGAATLVSKSGAITYTVSPSLLPVSPIDATGAAMGGVYNLAQSAVPVMIAQSGVVLGGGILTPGSGIAGSVSLSATSGSGVTATLGVAALTGTAADVGKQISFFDGTGNAWRSALITAAGTTSTCTVTLQSTASGLGPFNTANSLGNPLPANYTGGIWVYLPAGAVSGGAAGFYWCVATQTATANGILQVTTAYQSSMGVSSIPTGFVNAVGSGSNFTGVTSTVTLAAPVVPGGAMGANGALRPMADYVFPQNANAKATRFALAGVAFTDNTNTNNSGIKDLTLLRNRGVQTAQVGGTIGFGWTVGQTAGGALRYISADTSVNQALTVSAQLSNATDFIVLEGFTVEVLPRA